MVMGDLVREVDVAVLGGGPGGYSAAFRCADLGLDTIVIDASGRLGGTCLWEGCIPSKALLRVAALVGEIERARETWLDLGAPHVALERLRSWIEQRVTGRLGRGLAAVARSKQVEVVGGRAVFEDLRTVRVEGEEPQKLRFRHAIVATGSEAITPSFLTRPGARILGAAAALALAEVPARLLVVGSDYIALELAQIYAALGSRVELAVPDADLLPGVDPELVQPLARRCGRLFSAIHLGAAVTSLAETGVGVEAVVDGKALMFDAAVVPGDRRPRTDGLGLEATGASRDDTGAIVVNEQCRTADAHVWAVGDATGVPMLAHRAMRQGKVAAEAIAGRPAAFDAVAVPAVIFTDPEVAWCGLGHSEAERAGHEVKIVRFAWAASGRALTLDHPEGLTKLVVDAASGRILGAGLVGPGAAELVAHATLAIECALTVEDVAATIHAHPTLSESLMEAAASALR
jgi:dihydrolipoamide dehydrogenase